MLTMLNQRATLNFRGESKKTKMMAFNVHNASTVSSDLHRDEAFAYAAKNVVHWIDRGNCNQSTANTFFGLISSINTHSRKVAKSIKTKEDSRHTCLVMVHNMSVPLS